MDSTLENHPNNECDYTQDKPFPIGEKPMSSNPFTGIYDDVYYKGLAELMHDADVLPMSCFPKCSLCGYLYIYEEVKAHSLCNPSITNVCAICQIKTQKLDQSTKNSSLSSSELSNLFPDVNKEMNAHSGSSS